MSVSLPERKAPAQVNSWDHFSEADEMLWPSFFPVKHLLVCAILVNKTFGINLNNFWNIFPLTPETSGTYRCSIPACTIFHCPTTYKCKHLSPFLHAPWVAQLCARWCIPFICTNVCPSLFIGGKIGMLHWYTSNSWLHIFIYYYKSYSSSSRRKKRPGYSERI